MVEKKSTTVRDKKRRMLKIDKQLIEETGNRSEYQECIHVKCSSQPIQNYLGVICISPGIERTFNAPALQ